MTDGLTARQMDATAHLQAHLELLEAATYDEHQRLADSLAASGELQHILQLCSGPSGEAQGGERRVLPEAGHGAFADKAPRVAARVVFLLSDTAAGRRALVAAGACQSLAAGILSQRHTDAFTSGKQAIPGRRQERTLLTVFARIVSDQRCGPPLGQLFGPPQAAESSKDTATQFDTLQALQRAAARWVHDRPSRHAPVHLAVRVALEIEYILHHTTSSSTYDPQSNTLHTQQGDSHAAATERKHADRDSTGLFAQLLSPLSPSQFLRSYWEQRPVLIRSNNNDNASVSQLPSITCMLQRGMHLPAADASVHDVLSVFFHWVGEHTNDTDSGTSSDSDTDSDSGTSSDGDDDSDTDNDSDTSSDIGTSSDTAGSACGQGTTDRVVTRLKGEGHGKARVSPRQHAGLVYGSDVRLVRTVISGSRESFSFDIQGKTEGVTAKLTQGGAERGSQAVTVCVRRTEHWAKEGERVTLQDCKEAFEAGYTLALSSVGSRDPSYQCLQSSIQHTLGVSGGANLYLSPPGAQGLGAHYDDHCVWVVQLYGTKHWLVAPPATGDAQLPCSYQRAVTTVSPLSPTDSNVLSLTLHPGDVMYIPRGWAHQAHTPHTDTEAPQPTAASLPAVGSEQPHTQQPRTSETPAVVVSPDDLPCSKRQRVCPTPTPAPSSERVGLPNSAQRVASGVPVVEGPPVSGVLGGGPGGMTTSGQPVVSVVQGGSCGGGGEDAWWRVCGASLHLTLGGEVEPCLTWQAVLHAAIAAGAARLVGDTEAGDRQLATDPIGTSTFGYPVHAQDRTSGPAGAVGCQAAGSSSCGQGTAAAAPAGGGGGDAARAQRASPSRVVCVGVCQWLLHAAVCEAAGVGEWAGLRRLCPLACAAEALPPLLQQPVPQPHQQPHLQQAHDTGSHSQPHPNRAVPVYPVAHSTVPCTDPISRAYPVAHAAPCIDTIPTIITTHDNSTSLPVRHHSTAADATAHTVPCTDSIPTIVTHDNSTLLPAVDPDTHMGDRATDGVTAGCIARHLFTRVLQSGPDPLCPMPHGARQGHAAGIGRDITTDKHTQGMAHGGGQGQAAGTGQGACGEHSAAHMRNGVSVSVSVSQAAVVRLIQRVYPVLSTLVDPSHTPTPAHTGTGTCEPTDHHAPRSGDCPQTAMSPGVCAATTGASAGETAAPGHVPGAAAAAAAAGAAAAVAAPHAVGGEDVETFAWLCRYWWDRVPCVAPLDAVCDVLRTALGEAYGTPQAQHTGAASVPARSCTGSTSTLLQGISSTLSELTQALACVIENDGQGSVCESGGWRGTSREGGVCESEGVWQGAWEDSVSHAKQLLATRELWTAAWARLHSALHLA